MRCPSSLIWAMIIRMHRHSSCSSIPSRCWGQVIFRRFPANTNNSLAFAAWQVVNN